LISDVYLTFFTLATNAHIKSLKTYADIFLKFETILSLEYFTSN